MRKENTMNIYDELENLKVRARSNPELAQALLATREMKNPVSAFCRICNLTEYLTKRTF